MNEEENTVIRIRYRRHTQNRIKKRRRCSPLNTITNDGDRYRRRSWCSWLYYYCWCALILVLVIEASKECKHDCVYDEDDKDNDNDKEKKPPAAATTIDAAKRLIRRGFFFLDTNDLDLHFDSDFLSSWIEDIFVVLEPSFEKKEIESMVHEAKNEMMAAKRKTTTTRRTTNSSSSNSNGNGNITINGECSATPSSSEEDNSCNSDNKYKQKFTGDRHAAGLLQMVDDPDCLHGELDARNPSLFDIQSAKRILVKCRMLVLRNLFSKETTDAVLPAYTRYVRDIRSGAIGMEGTTTFGGDYFVLKEDRDNSRFNYLATKELVQQSKGLLDSDVLVELLADPALLGEDVIVNHVGTIHALPGARAQYWHTDGPYLYYDSENENDNDQNDGDGVRVAGHDLPPYAINMFTPLVPSAITPRDGPTEFCLGSSYLRGHDYEADLPVQNLDLLTQKDGIVEDLQEFEWTVENYGHSGDIECPEVLRRIPLLNTGDALLFDYLVTHRGGANRNFDDDDDNDNDLDGRSMVFATYSRKWFRDTNFDTDFGNSGETETELEELTKLSRYAVVGGEDEAKDDTE
uniref:Phytanoyl-CoA dioxygenase n=1 Tax=Pseudo-nitzschia australis TaxID=44445 RepID=A0A7S4EIT3_9STRA